MTTTVTWTPYGGSTAYQLAPAVTVNNGTGNVRRDLNDFGTPISFGNAKWLPFFDDKSLFSGKLYRGGVFDFREGIVLPIFSRCSTEALLQAEKRALQAMFSPELGLGTLTITTPNGTTVAECLCMDFPAFTHSPQDANEAFGPLSAGQLLSVVLLTAPDPWFYAPLATKVSGAKASGATFSISNPSPTFTGVYAEFTPPGGASVSALEFELENTTTGKTWAVGALDIPAGAKLVVDWYGTHDEALEVYVLDGSTETDAMRYLTVSSELLLAPGTNDFVFTSGTAGSWTFLMKTRERYLTP